MPQVVYTLKNLRCAYPAAEHPCLLIEELELFREETTFILGASGCGKSTLLETFGLMNNTVVPTNDLVFNYSSDFGSVDLNDFWNWDRNRQSDFRSSELGFIFQSTHLFQSLSIWDNVKLPALVGHRPEAEIDERLSGLFDRILNGVDRAKSGTAVSGGQRQRLAFIRAFCAPHRVLLADEPTGNLDPGNASILMEEVRGDVAQGRSAIIVSHDIPLALRFADRIILLIRDRSLPGEPGYYENKLDFRKDDQGLWSNGLESQTQTELQSMIQDYFDQEAQLCLTS